MPFCSRRVTGGGRFAGWRKWETWEGEDPNQPFVPQFTMYSLRHTAASLALRAGVNVRVVSAMLGHASVTLTLDTYAHLIEAQQEDVAERIEKVLGGTRGASA